MNLPVPHCQRAALFSWVSAIFCLLGLAGAFAQEPVSVEPPGLLELRFKYLAAMRHSIEPLDSSYVQTLTDLRERFMEAADVRAAQSVTVELEKVAAELSAFRNADTAPVILSAQQRDAADKAHPVDITAAVKKAYLSGAPVLSLNAFRDTGSLGAPPPRRETVIVYSSGGERKEKIFPERSELNFAQDLR